MTEIQIPGYGMSDDGRPYCRCFCPLYQIDGCIIGAKVEGGRPGSNCPGPNVYVLMPKAQWKAAQGLGEVVMLTQTPGRPDMPLTVLARMALGEVE